MTKKEMYGKLLDYLYSMRDADLFGDTEYFTETESEEILTMLTAEKARLETRANTPRKPTARQEENETFKAAILAALADSEPVTIGGLVDLCPTLKGLSNQRITHMMTALRGEGQVKREYRKKVAYFSLGTEDTNEQDEPTKEQNDRQMEQTILSRMIAAYDAGVEG